MKKILITGGGGFLGTNTAIRLLGKGYKVILVDNFSRGGSDKNFESLKKKYPKVTLHKKEIIDVPSLIAKERPDLVFHFAAQVAVTTSVLSPISDFRINGEGTFLVAHAAHEFGIPLIYSSTNKVFGDNVNSVPIIEHETRYDFAGSMQKKGIREDFSIDAKSHTPYGCSKLVGDIYVREFGGIVNRCSCMYGPYQHGIVDQGWFSYFIEKKLKGEKITIFGDGKQVRDALHVNDVVDLFLLQAEHLLDPKKRVKVRGEVFNVGGGYDNSISVLELCNKIGAKYTFSNWRPSDQKVFYCDISKANKFFGWKPKVSLDKGIKELTTWQKKKLDKVK